MISLLEQKKILSNLIKGSNESTSDIGNKLGVSRQTVHNWQDMSKSTYPSGQHMYVLAEILDTTVEYLTTGKSSNREIKSIDIDSQNLIQISLLSATGSMGAGVSADLNHDEVVNKVSLSKKFINSHLGSVTSPSNIRLITGIGNSMEGVFDDGDVLFADIGVQEVTSDAVYVVMYRGEIYIKNVQRVPGGGLKLISSNKVYEAIPILGDDLQDAQVLAKIIGTWNFNKI